MLDKNKKYILHFILIVASCIMIYPLFLIFASSFKTPEEILKYPLSMPQSLYLNNFIEAWKKGNFSHLFISSIKVTVLGTILIFIVNTLTAYPLARMKFRGNKLLFIIFLSGIMFPIQTAVIPLFQIVKSLGLVNKHASLILSYAAFSLPIGVYILSNFMKTIPYSIEESAFIDGCNRFHIFYRILLPLIKPATATVIIINTLGIWNDLLLPMLFITSNNNKTLPAGLMFFTGRYLQQWELIIAAITIMCIPVIILYLFMQKDIISGLSAGSVKG